MTDSLQAPSLRWELFIRKRASATQGVPSGKESLSWVANTVTLFWGQRDAALVDTFLSDAHSAELADWIETKGRTLRTIYLTHAHPDLFFGLTLLLKRFPEARAVAMPNVVEAMRVQSSDEVLETNWKRRFPGQVPEQLTVAGSLEAGRFELEGRRYNGPLCSLARPRDRRGRGLQRNASVPGGNRPHRAPGMAHGSRPDPGARTGQRDRRPWPARSRQQSRSYRGHPPLYPGFRQGRPGNRNGPGTLRRHARSLPEPHQSRIALGQRACCQK
ncbi:hypothetical protein [Azospirillum largimobile]